MKVGLDIVQLSGDVFQDVKFLPINSLTISNTHTSDVVFDLVVGNKSLSLGNTDTGAIYILKQIPIPTGSTFDWEANTFLQQIGLQSNLIRKYNNTRKQFELLSGLTFLIRVGSSQTADVLIRRR